MRSLPRTKVTAAALLFFAALAGCESAKDSYLRESAVLKELEASWMTARTQNLEATKNLKTMAEVEKVNASGDSHLFGEDAMSDDEVAAAIAEQQSLLKSSQAELDRLQPLLEAQKRAVSQAEAKLPK